MERFDSRPWLRPLKVPSAMVITTRDEAVSPRKQRELAAALGAKVIEAALRHNDLPFLSGQYNPALLDALAAVRETVPSRKAPEEDTAAA
jgi:predicted alpha/beta hydrolase family esterase